MKRVEVTYVTHDDVLQTLEFLAGGSTIKDAAATAARGVEYAKNADRMITLSLMGGQHSRGHRDGGGGVMARATDTDPRVTLYRVLLTRTYNETGATFTHAAGPYHTRAACKLALAREQREGASRWGGFAVEGRIQEADVVWMDTLT
jgi:hypothetical protein